MVAHCVNPGCRKEFKLLNAGDLYLHETRHSDTEFFWLCSGCTTQFDLCLDPTGGVRLKLRGERAFPLYLGALPKGSTAGFVRRTKGVRTSHGPWLGSYEFPATVESQLPEVTSGRGVPPNRLLT